MQFYGIPMETQLNICVFPQNYRIEKPKLVEIIWLALLDLWGRQRQAMGPCPGETSPGTRHRGRASIFAWQCGRESEYLSLAVAAWCRMLKEAGLLHVGRETLYRHKKYLQIYKNITLMTFWSVRIKWQMNSKSKIWVYQQSINL